MALQGLEHDPLDVVDRFPEELFARAAQELGLHDDFALGDPGDGEGNALRRLHVLANWVEGHDLERNAVRKRKRSVRNEGEILIFAY